MDRMGRLSTFLLIWVWGFAVTVRAASSDEKIQSDCTASEMRVLRNKDILQQVAAESKVQNQDCTILKDKILAVYVLNDSDGVESYLAVFAREGLSVKSKLVFKSEPLGWASHPLLAKGKRRLVFVVPPVKADETFVYTNTQTGPSAAEFKKWKINLNKKSILPVEGHAFPLDLGQRPQIFVEKGKWRAVVKGKLVDL